MYHAICVFHALLLKIYTVGAEQEGQNCKHQAPRLDALGSGFTSKALRLSARTLLFELTQDRLRAGSHEAVITVFTALAARNDVGQYRSHFASGAGLCA